MKLPFSETETGEPSKPGHGMGGSEWLVHSGRAGKGTWVTELKSERHTEGVHGWGKRVKEEAEQHSR